MMTRFPNHPADRFLFEPGSDRFESGSITLLDIELGKVAASYMRVESAFGSNLTDRFLVVWRRILQAQRLSQGVASAES